MKRALGGGSAMMGRVGKSDSSNELMFGTEARTLGYHPTKQFGATTERFPPAATPQNSASV